jgi:hypothetical protein
MSEKLSPRMAAARAVLVDRVVRTKTRGMPGVLPAIGLVLVGVLVGGAASAAVAVAVNRSEPTASVVLPAPLMGEELPGTPIISVAGDAQVFTLATTESFTVPTPPGATSVRVRLSCLSAGQLTIWTPFRQSGLGSGCSDAIGDGAFSGGYGFSPVGSEVPFDVVTDGTVASLSVQFVREVSPAWAVNSAGQTYGIIWHGAPDLAAVVGSGDDGRPVVGYVPAEYALRPQQEKAAEWKRELLSRYPDGVVPMTTGDGLTVVGGFSVDDDANDLWLDTLWEEIAAAYPAASRPEPSPGEGGGPTRDYYVMPSEWPTAMTSCLVTAGYADAVATPASTVEGLPDTMDAALAEYGCWSSLAIVTHVTWTGE